MPKFFSRRKEPYNLRSRSKNQSCTPKSKVDACVECDLPFDESKIAPELRRGPVVKEGTSSEPLEPSHKNSVRFNTTNLEPVDISVDSDSDDSLSALDLRRLRALVESEEELSSENEREKEKEKENFTDSIFATGSQQVPASSSPATGSTSPPSNTIPPTTTPVDPTVIEQPEVLNTTPIVPDNAAGGQPLPNINSPADIYEHFSRRVDYRDNFKTGTPPSSNLTGSHDKTDRTPDDSSDNSECESALPATNTESCNTCDATGIMQAEELTRLQDQVIALQQELKSQQEKAHVFRTKTISAFEQTPIPDVSSPHRPTAFHGFDSEDINRWLDKVENYLTLRRIDTSTPTALAELVLNLAGPAEDFYYSLPGDCKDTFTKLRDALKERFANENQSWIIWQAITTRQQGPVEPLDTYLTDLTGKFRRINISDADKMRYFVQGLRADLRETVLLKQPKTFREAEEMARLASAVKTTMSNSNETVTIQLHNLTKTLNTLVANSNSPVSTNQQQSLHTQVETLTQKVNSLMPTVTKSDKVAAYSEPQVDFQSKIEDLTKLVKRMEGNFQDQIASLDKRMDARITGLAQRQRETRNTRERSRDGRPYCYVCGLPGHYQNSCPRRNNRERDRTPVPRYALPAPDNYTRYSSGPQARQRALPPPPHQSRIAAFQDSTPTSSSQPELPIYDSPKYDSFDWDYYYGDFNDDDFYGHWDYYYDYEPETEASNNVDELDGVYEETPPTSVSTLVENLHSTVTTDQLLLPPFPFQDPCPSSWPSKAAGLLLEETRAAPNPLTELSLANFGKNPEQPQQGPIPSATPQLDAGMSSLPPFTDKVDQLADSFEMGTEFDPPVPATNPVPTATAIRSKTADTTILGHYPPADHEPKEEPAMTYQPATVDILPPPYPGDVGVDPTQYFGTNYPKPALAGYNKVAPRKAQPQTKEVKQKSTAIAYSTLNADNHVTGDSSRSRHEDLPTESPTAMHSGEKTSNSVSAQNVREMVTTQVSKQVKPLTNQETDRTTKLEQNYHVAPKAIPSDQSSFPCPEIRQSNPDTGQPGSNHSLRAQIVSTEPKTKRATHSQLHNDYQHELKDQLTKVIKDLEGNLLNKITILERRLGGNSRHSKVQPWKRTCFYCGMVGHIQINCPHRSCQQGSYNYKVLHKPERIPHQAPTFQPAYTARDKPRCQDSGEEPYDVNHNSTKVGVILDQPKEVLKLGHLSSVAANSFKQTSFQIPNVPPNCRNLLNSQEQEKPKYQQNTLISSSQTPGERIRNQQVARSCTEKSPSQKLTKTKILTETDSEEIKDSNMMITGDIAGQNVNFLLDTGACASIIDEKLLYKIYDQGATILTNGSVQFVETITGQKVPLLGKVEIPVEINGVLYPSCFQVVQGLCHEAILGQDFLQAYGAVIDFKNKRVKLEDTSLHFKEMSRTTEECIIPTYALRFRRNQRSATIQASQSSKTPTIIKNAVKLQKAGKSATLQPKISFMFEKFISWFMLLVLFHLCFASQAHNLPPVQLTTQKLHNMHDYRQSAEKELFPSPKNDGRLTTETHTHNWHQPVSSTKFKHNFPLLNDDPLDDLIPKDLTSK